MGCVNVETDSGNANHTQNEDNWIIEKRDKGTGKVSCQSALLYLRTQWNQIAQDKYKKPVMMKTQMERPN